MYWYIVAPSDILGTAPIAPAASVGDVCIIGDCGIVAVLTVKSGFWAFFSGNGSDGNKFDLGMSSILMLMFLHNTCTSNLMFILRSSNSYNSRRKPSKATSQGLGGRKTLESRAPSMMRATKEQTAMRRPVPYPQNNSSFKSMRRWSSGLLRASVICPSQMPKLRNSDRSDEEVVMLGDCKSLVTL